MLMWAVDDDCEFSFDTGRRESCSVTNSNHHTYFHNRVMPTGDSSNYNGWDYHWFTGLVFVRYCV
jgi:hypothetical protein